MSVYQSIKLSIIETPEDRIRDVDQEWAECLRDMFKEMGQKTPIDVVQNGKRYTLVAGAHRLTAAKLARWREINARVLEPSSEHSADEMRLHEILENLGRKNFNALERCEALSELKRVYEALHPETKHGGDRKSQATKNKRENQIAIFAFCQNAAETTGLSRRTVELAIQIFRGLSPQSRERLKGTLFAEKQSDLKALADLDADVQSRVLDLILGEMPKAKSVADALIITEGRRPLTASERLLITVSDSMVKLSKVSRAAVFRQHRWEIVEQAKKEGWLDEEND
ncbi:ParB-like nuclease domain protein [Stappia aggregata IAM 12614]|uniref:ParB-like nuclease domain protein n=1 Tax=Roseibium aggregatum (strain ATCC 25650 / DSM 13394 / JCM 20685 / NBRC 16684 / NCIMB 2208 / IAM 12614 / B1) TaxID=384765 RepID=A0P3H2_ROSAI|nr:ParB N-terminal domain-containing protein [Roseibium aggregatum]EAV40420.1 ParB-like nuclease domain protein [Stappia aggregata IAM 12614] [Roseibium aggregatum IAM 12614]